ncbi:hypothetical protein H6G97_43325 [Nostoc flagelliforme FACHB-838]|uniref:Uncharacterized protein n=1 Tax=Nostoc flagelliforme FACHB-838 TaxID=2692904 RepID=A0ABR8E309_9NOSO|nr:hypothetical protein [Nostoc flagelliforme]MBD2535823.1 hypothetical protein [Nostoc flagelliforme FACHB-838]
MSAQTEEIKELDPLVFCEIWGLSYEQASEYLNIRARTMTAYACSKSSKTHRQPSSRVKALAAIHHNKWLKEGKSFRPEGAW